MKYYEILAKSIANSHELALSPVNMYIINYFDASPVQLEEPIEVSAFRHHEDDREDDYVCAGNPQVVSEDFKNLVEELDPTAAQFFLAKPINCTTKKQYYVMHVTKTVSCLDREHSKIIPDPLGYKDEEILVGAIDGDRVPPDTHVFRLAEDVTAYYVSGKFLREYRKRKLRGCIFDLRTFED